MEDTVKGVSNNNDKNMRFLIKEDPEQVGKARFKG